MELAARGSAVAMGLGAAVRRDRLLLGLAASIFMTGAALRPEGQRPDWDLVAAALRNMGLVAVCAAAGLVAWRLAWLAVVARSRAPARDLLGWAGRGLAAPGLAGTVASTLIVFALFAAGFAVLKGAIAVLSPFAWDAALAGLDRWLHFGGLPHEWLAPLTAPLPVALLNVAYNLWFFVVLASWVASAVAVRRQGLRRRYLLAFMLTWIVGGFFVAMGVSSAGPCYFARMGLGDDYAPLMQALARADGVHRVWALTTQDLLWEGYVGARPGSGGISAFPSMHVATATLFVLAARAFGRAALAGAVVYWAAIMAGSVVLGWHYAVDGYAGAAIAVAAWRLSAGEAGEALADQAYAEDDEDHHQDDRCVLDHEAPDRIEPAVGAASSGEPDGQRRQHRR